MSRQMTKLTCSCRPRRPSCEKRRAGGFAESKEALAVNGMRNGFLGRLHQHRAR